MQDSVELVFNSRIELTALLEFLREVDFDFPVPLSDKVDLGDYAEKLLAEGDVVAYVDSTGRVKGAAAGYIRNSTGPLSYLSVLAVSGDLRGRGAGRKLVSRFLDEAESAGLLGVHLYADSGNLAALATYDGLGFVREDFSAEPRPGDVHYLKLLNKTALVTAIGSFSAARVIEGLRAAGFRVVGCDIYPREWVANSLRVDEFYQVPLASSGEEYVGAVNDIVSKERVGYVLPLTDYEVDALRRARDAVKALVCMSGDDALGLCRDKLACFERLAEGFGSDVIPTRRMSDCSAAELDYPVIVKPLNGRSSEGLAEIASAGSFERALGELDAAAYCVQPKIEGRVATVDVVRDPLTGESAAIPREELLRTPNGAGTSVRVYPDDGLESLAKGIAAALGVTGCINLEFIIEPDGTPRFLECNPRFSGGVEFSCIAGYDCVTNHLRCFLGLRPEGFSLGGELYMARSYEAHVTGRTAGHGGGAL